MEKAYQGLAEKLEGEVFIDDTTRVLYATDASSYRQKPQAVAYPKSEVDIQTLVKFAIENKTSLIPRTAGTSLAGQVVGEGIVVDVSKYMTGILEVNQEEKWVRVQPGVIRDELNVHLKPFGLYFGPETSTSNRAMIGGMVGNNSCGSNSVVYGSTRDHLIELKGVLADGSTTVFEAIDTEDFEKKANEADSELERNIYAKTKALLAEDGNRKEITEEYPDPNIPRRNTGYALDLLMDADPFEKNGKPFNFCKLLSGSEGTLVLTTEVKLSLQPLPPKYGALVCVHFESIYESLKATQIALKYNPSAVELMDNYILECTKNNRLQRANRFFVEGDPEALIVVEIRRESEEEIQKEADSLIEELKSLNYGYHYPLVWNADISKVWSLRKAGLGLLSNIPGDAKPVPVIEDTAVHVDVLPEYIQEFNVILKKYNMSCVHYAHAGSGEIHLRPILDLKTKEGTDMFHTIADEIAHLVKKYKGSLSGEHGDGRLRGEFIEFMIGEKNYEMLKVVKKAWDPNNIFNPNKIVDTPSMNSSLRFDPGQKTPEYKTTLDFSATQGIVRAAEQCNGSGDCRKTEITGGTMCPSYMATKDERHTTRARANIFREIAGRAINKNPFKSKQIKEVMDLCLSCKACKSECPSNVDIAKIKAEFQHQYQQQNGVPFRNRIIGNFSSLTKLASYTPWAYRMVFSTPILSSIAKGVIGFAKKRSMPKLHSETLRTWYNKNQRSNFGLSKSDLQNGEVVLFCDEFSNYNDVDAGKAVLKLLTALGYKVLMPKTVESGRSYLSKGMLTEAGKVANKNIDILKNVVTGNTPMIGIEPSAILSFRDEYLDLATKENKEDAKKLASDTYLFEEFLAGEIDKGKVDSSKFTNDEKVVKYHGHCHQKALSSMTPLKKVLSLAKNYDVRMIQSGCCGMAGSFGYEKEHYDVSMKIGELVLFPAVRSLKENGAVVAPGTSCRHQILDGTGAKALHPAELLWSAFKK